MKGTLYSLQRRSAILLQKPQSIFSIKEPPPSHETEKVSLHASNAFFQIAKGSVAAVLLPIKNTTGNSLDILSISMRAFLSTPSYLTPQSSIFSNIT